MGAVRDRLSPSSHSTTCCTRTPVHVKFTGEKLVHRAFQPFTDGLKCALKMLERRVHSEEEEEEGEGGLEIDLDYNDYVSVSLTEEEEEEVEEPLDLRVGREPAAKEERLLSSVPLSANSPEEVGKGTLLTEKDVISLLDPYIGWDRKRAVCTVCEIKFVKREKARAHIENKHLDCLQYKCPLCRASKVTRLAYESHLRRGHSAKARDYQPQIRLKRRFGLTGIRGSSGSTTGRSSPPAGTPSRVWTMSHGR